MKIPTSLVMILLDGAASVMACYDEQEERQFIAVCTQTDVPVIGVFTPDEEMRAELNLSLLSSSGRAVPMEHAWNASTKAERIAGHPLPMSVRDR